MMASLIGFLSGTFAWVLRASWQASLLALFVLAAQWALRGRLRARARCLLWGVVVLRLIAPPLPQARWTLFGGKPPSHMTQAAVHEAKPVSILLDGPKESVIPPPSAEIHSAVMSQSGPAAARSVRVRLATLLPWAWALGVVLPGLRLLVSSIRLVRSTRQCRRLADPDLESLARDCAAVAGLRRSPPLLAAPHLSGPAITGFFAPRLLIPPELAANFSRAELRLMLLHEFAHLRRRDLQLSWLLGVLTAIHWFNPLLRRAVARVRADCELACDEFVLDVTALAAPDGQRQTYGQALLRLAELLTQRPHSAAPVALGQIGILDGPRHLHRRIRMIAQFNPASRTFSRTWPAVVAGALLFCAGALLADAADPSQPKAAEVPGKVAPAATVKSGGGEQADRVRLSGPEAVLPAGADTFESLAVASAQLRVKAAAVSLKSKRAEFQRVRLLHDQAAASEADFEKASTDVELAELNVQMEEVNLRIAQLTEKSKAAASVVPAGAGATPNESARSKAAFLVSVNHMKQILIGIHMYAGDHDGRLPQSLREDFKPYLEGQGDALFTNPRAPNSKEGYVYVRPAEKLSDLKDAATTVLLYEAADGRLDGVAVGYADGHVEKRTNLDEVKAGTNGVKP